MVHLYIWCVCAAIALLQAYKSYDVWLRSIIIKYMEQWNAYLFLIDRVAGGETICSAERIRELDESSGATKSIIIRSSAERWTF